MVKRYLTEKGTDGEPEPKASRGSNGNHDKEEAESVCDRVCAECKVQ